MAEIIRCLAAGSLPEQWDQASRSYFQRRRFLSHAEIYNPCGQRYYLMENSSRLLAGACVYSLKIDLFTFSAIKSPVTMHVIGVPASVSCSGLIGAPGHQNELLEHILEQEKGIILVLNIPPGQMPARGIVLRTLPTVEITHPFSTWEEFVAGMRSEYRRRVRKITDPSHDLLVKRDDCSDYSDSHHELYLQVWNKSTTRLEKLTLEFFRHLPPEFELVSMYRDGKLAAWHINLKEDERLVFFFGGIDYSVNRTLNAYFNNLLCIVREGVTAGYKNIELGQTAETPKLRLGGKLIEKNMVIYHHNTVVMFFLRLITPLAGYNRTIPATHVFKN
jgi:hypothetical protein